MEEIYPASINNNDDARDAGTVEQGQLPPPSPSVYDITNTTFRDLFIWAVLMNYIDMSKMLLAHMNHRILCSSDCSKNSKDSF